MKPALLATYLLWTAPCGHASLQSGSEGRSASAAGVGDVHQRQCEGAPRVRGACYNVEGELQLWNGWPPNVQLSANGVLYGVGRGEGEDLPDAILSRLTEDGVIRGTMRICPLGDEVRVPYQKRALPLVCVEALKRQEP